MECVEYAYGCRQNEKQTPTHREPSIGWLNAAPDTTNETNSEFPDDSGIWIPVVFGNDRRETDRSKSKNELSARSAWARSLGLALITPFPRENQTLETTAIAHVILSPPLGFSPELSSEQNAKFFRRLEYD